MAPSVSAVEYYAGKNVFITGATGFIGKALVEKLLRSCPGVGKIYMLMREKKGKSVKERLNVFLNCPIFDNLRQNSPESLEKLRIVSGDITQENLGISAADRSELQNNCHVVFHIAACVRFDMPLRAAVEYNTKATKSLLEIVEGIKNLEVFVHVSTSYCQHEKVVLEEKLYPTPHSPQRIMDFVEWMDDDMLADIEQKFIYPHGNTYAYTKALTEQLVSQYAGKFPIAIARPSIVIASFKEPMPGWVDNLNGPTGVMLVATKGVIHSMLCYEEYQIDGVPLDITVNGCILLGYLTALEKSSEIRICNVTQSGVNAINWKTAINIGYNLTYEYPYSQFLWVPWGAPSRSWLWHNIKAFFFHFLPAYFIDILVFLLGKKPFMVKVYKRVKFGLEILSYYSTKEWIFRNDYFRSLKNVVSKEDNNIFYTDIAEVDWNIYMKNYILGIRKYICHEDPANLPQAKRVFNM
ncbi:putative fatty acyl-CoA reductase CG5065 [Epargyreus clarus]|uniref:putative fatty acyl-CoA reductase CG5065 n=1 Tax=Epargyreus clarus TaxID=520877 RepID=UPI003C3094C8